MVEPKPAGIGAEPPAPLLSIGEVGDLRASTLSDTALAGTRVAAEQILNLLHIVVSN